ncbi:alternative ribosome rescue aminoacyl-tRNA hydrolase ArfB [Micromonospora sp. M12]
MDDGLRVTDRWVVPAGELRERFSRSSGPGGQGVNTADSRVELSYDLANSPAVPEWLRSRALARLANRLIDGVLTIAASEHRAQLANREAARARMTALLREAAAPHLRPAERPAVPRGQERRLAEKKRQSQRKRDRRTDDD